MKTTGIEIKKVTEDVIAEVVNNTMPSNDQMITVRLLRGLIPYALHRVLQVEREETLNKVEKLFWREDRFNDIAFAVSKEDWDKFKKSLIKKL